MASKNNSKKANNTGTSALLTTFVQHKFYRHSGPHNQQNQKKHGSFNSGRHHRKLPPPYCTYSTGGGADYHTIHSISKLLRANARSIEYHLGGGALSHLSIIVLIATFATVAPAHPWENPEFPGGVGRPMKSLGVLRMYY
jgi:hypothetical protein